MAKRKVKKKPAKIRRNPIPPPPELPTEKELRTKAVRAKFAEMNETDKAVFKLRVTRPTMTADEIADYLDLHPSHVREVWNKPAFKSALDEFHMSDIERAPIIIHEATRVFQNLMKTGSEATKARLAIAALQSPRGILYPKRDSGDEDDSGIIVVETDSGETVLAMGTEKKVMKEVGPRLLEGEKNET